MFRALKEELRYIAHNRVYFALLTLLPALSLLFFYTFFCNLSIDKLPIAIVDLDNSATSRNLVEMIEATPYVSVEYSTQNTIEAEQLIRSGRAYATVIIPHEFESYVLRKEPCSIALYNNGTNISTNGFIEKDIQTVVTTLNAAVSIKNGETLAEVLPINIEQHILFNPELDYAAYLAPCFMPMMVMIFSLLGTVMATAERKSRGIKHLIGRCLPTTFPMIIFAIIMLSTLFYALQIPLNGSAWIVIIATILLVFDYQAIGVILSIITRNRHLAISLGGGYSVLAFTFSGLTFPTFAMFPVLRIASHLFPFTYYMKIIIEQALRGAPIYISLPNLGIMLLFAILPVLIHKRL